LEVFFAHRQSAAEQGKAGFGVAFDWDVDLLSGYHHRFLRNVSTRPGVDHFFGCDTPEIANIVKKAESRKQRAEGEGANSNSQLSDFSFQLSAFSVSPFDAFIVTGWHLKSYWQAVRACRRAGVSVLVRGDSQLGTPRSWLKRSIKAIGYRILLRQFNGFLVVGQRNREYLAHYGVPTKKMFFAPHFVDNEWFAAQAAVVRGQRSMVRKEWGAGDADLVVLFVGKLQAIKRPGDLLRAIVKMETNPEGRVPRVPNDSVRDSFDSPLRNVLAVFVGSGELEQELREMAARENLRVYFAGFKNQSELPRFYVAADVLVLPSESETWGLVVNEGMACGLPAIVSGAVGCAADLIEEGRTGFTFLVGDCRLLARRIESLAVLKRSGHDFAPALAEKLCAYSVEAAVRGTVLAVETLSK
jgi:glycosyltransferase involved in cell wall biosynthesis